MHGGNIPTAITRVEKEANMEGKVTPRDFFPVCRCGKKVMTVVYECKKCLKYYHESCIKIHTTYNSDNELERCKGKIEIVPGTEKKEKNEDDEKNKQENTTKTLAADHSRDRQDSTGSIESVTLDEKVDWLVATIQEMAKEMVCSGEVKKLIKDIIREEVAGIKQEMEDIKRMIQGGQAGPSNEVRKTYSSVVKEKEKEKVIIIKPKIQQESEKTKEMIKQKVDIKTMAVGVSRMKKCSNGTVILGCETGEEIRKLKDTVQEKMGENFKVTESNQAQPKVKIVNIDSEEMKLEDDELIEIIKMQNRMEEREGREIKIVKRLNRERDEEQIRRRGNEGSLIMQMDEETHQEMLSRGKISVGWKKCAVYNHVNVKRCFKCWGYYHIAKNCTREETCHKCAGNHKASECEAENRKCVNCTHKNQAFNLKINVEHDALDKECPTFKRAMQEEKRRAGWVE